MDASIVNSENEQPLIGLDQKSQTYPGYVLDGVTESLKESEEGKLMSYTGIKDMLNLS